MIIYGWRIFHTTIDRQEFPCPMCRVRVEGELKRADRWFTLYFIPVFPLGTSCEFVECTMCRTGFRKEILTEPQLLADFEPPAEIVVPDAPPAVDSPYRIEVTTRADDGQGPYFGPTRAATKSTSPAAMLSLLLGLVALGTFWHLTASLASAVTAILCGHLGLAAVRRRPLETSGRSLANAGLYLAYLSVLAAGGWTAWTKMNAPQPADPRSAQMLDVAGMFVIRNDGDPTSGNTPQAQTLAATLGRALEEQHDKVLFSIPRNGKPYRVWCQLHDGSCAFVVGPPGGDRFDPNSMEKVRLNAWYEAYRIVCAELKNQGRLGVRVSAGPWGGPVMIGTYGEAPLARPESSKSESHALLPFFQPPPLAPAP